MLVLPKITSGGSRDPLAIERARKLLKCVQSLDEALVKQGVFASSQLHWPVQVALKKALILSGGGGWRAMFGSTAFSFTVLHAKV